MGPKDCAPMDKDELCLYSECSSTIPLNWDDIGVLYAVTCRVPCVMCRSFYIVRGEKENRRTYKTGNKEIFYHERKGQNRTKQNTDYFGGRVLLFCRIFLSLALSYVSSSLDSGNLFLAGISQNCCCVLLSGVTLRDIWHLIIGDVNFYLLDKVVSQDLPL